MILFNTRGHDQALIHRPHRPAGLSRTVKARPMIDDHAGHDPVAPQHDARDLQARLYREIGISAVAAALRFVNQPDPGKAPAAKHELPAILREEPKAA